MYVLNLFQISQKWIYLVRTNLNSLTFFQSIVLRHLEVIKTRIEKKFVLSLVHDMKKQTNFTRRLDYRNVKTRLYKMQKCKKPLCKKGLKRLFGYRRQGEF